MAKLPPALTKCSECGVEFTAYGQYELQKIAHGHLVACGNDCAKTRRRRISSETMARTNRKYASERMKRNNPMSKPGVRERVSETMKRRGHQPKVKGGNGRPATEAERKLVEIFGPLGFREQCIVKTGLFRMGYPSHYKIDCGNDALKIAVEADGKSHNTPSRRGQDKKKDRFLTERGWRVFRFNNDVILGQPELVFETVLVSILERH